MTQPTCFPVRPSQVARLSLLAADASGWAAPAFAQLTSSVSSFSFIFLFLLFLLDFNLI